MLIDDLLTAVYRCGSRTIKILADSVCDTADMCLS